MSKPAKGQALEGAECEQHLQTAGYMLVNVLGNSEKSERYDILQGTAAACAGRS